MGKTKLSKRRERLLRNAVIAIGHPNMWDEDTKDLYDTFLRMKYEICKEIFSTVRG